MTESEFEEKKSAFACPHCGTVGKFTVEKRDPHIGLYCSSCKRHIRWLRSDKNILRRKHLSAGTTEDVWSAYDNRCAVCNLSPEQMAKIGIFRTVQHVPAYKEAGDDAHLIPLCSWCQDHATATMKRMEALLKRIPK